MRGVEQVVGVIHSVFVQRHDTFKHINVSYEKSHKAENVCLRRSRAAAACRRKILVKASFKSSAPSHV